MIRYFSDSSGRHVCTTDGEDRPSLIETVGPPPSPSHRWDGAAWVDSAVSKPLTVEALAAALEKKGHLTKGDIDAERGKK